MNNNGYLLGYSLVTRWLFVVTRRIKLYSIKKHSLALLHVYLIVYFTTFLKNYFHESIMIRTYD